MRRLKMGFWSELFKSSDERKAEVDLWNAKVRSGKDPTEGKGFWESFAEGVNHGIKEGNVKKDERERRG
jgi:hypothetical protein